MNYKKLLVFTVLLLFLVFLVSFYFFTTKNKDLGSDNSSLSPITDKPTPTANMPTDNVIYDNSWVEHSNLDFSFKYPSQAKAEARDDESLVIYMGQKQIDSGRTQTEIFDGYTFRITKVDLDQNLSAKDLAIQEFEIEQENCTNSDESVVTNVVDVVVGQKQGYQFTGAGCYTDFTETIVSNGDNVYRIVQIYAGESPDLDLYKKTTEKILQSLVFN